MRITWLGHSSLKVETKNHIIYIDPFAGQDEWYSRATLILVSQANFDHCSLEKIKLLQSDDTHILGTREVAAQFFPAGVLLPGERREFDDVTIIGMQAVPLVKRSGTQRGMVLGFVILAENKKLQYVGDSDYSPEFGRVEPDILIVPVGGTQTLNPKEAAKLTNAVRPKYAIPVHWGCLNGTIDDAQYFKELAACPVKILHPGENLDV